MKSFNKRVNKRKASKVTLKTHHKHNHPIERDVIKGALDSSTLRDADVKLHHR